MAKRLKDIKRFVLKRPRRLVIILVILLLFGSYKIYSSRKTQKGVEKTTVQKGVVAEELILSGQIAADEHLQLTFPTSGKIAWVGVKEGDKVTKYQALASLDKTTLDAAYQQARSQLRKYEATVDNIHDQVKNKDKSETYSERDTRTTAEANKDYYYDAFRAAEYNLKNATLTAPFEGLVTFIAYPAGVNILPTQTEIELVNPKTIYFDVAADQSEIIKLKTDNKTKIIFDSFSDKELEGKISFLGITPKAGESGANYKIKVVFDNPQDAEKLRIGMTGDARFILSEKENVLYVPSKFINSDIKGKYVNKGKKNKKVYIKTGLEGEERTEIIEGVSEGNTLYD